MWVLFNIFYDEGQPIKVRVKSLFFTELTSLKVCS